MNKLSILLIAIATLTFFSCDDDDDEKVVVKDYGLKTFSADLDYDATVAHGGVAYKQQIYFSLSDSSAVDSATYGTDEWTTFYLIEDSSQANFISDVENWEIAFTYYTALITQYGTTTPYGVVGTLINIDESISVGLYDYEMSDSTSTTEATSAFTALTLDDVSDLEYSSDADAIGYDWKSFDMSTYAYTVDTTLFYIVKLSSGDTYKLRFLSFYGSSTTERIITIQYQLMQ